ncbi:MAG: VOC family protein [Patescibacteria group bacterium]
MHASESEQCGWCKDRYGLSWQIIPKNVGELLKRPNAFANMMKMHKLEIAKF